MTLRAVDLCPPLLFHLRCPHYKASFHFFLITSASSSVSLSQVLENTKLMKLEVLDSFSFPSIFLNVTLNHWLNHQILWLLFTENMKSDFFNTIALPKTWYWLICLEMFLVVVLSLVLASLTFILPKTRWIPMVTLREVGWPGPPYLHSCPPNSSISSLPSPPFPSPYSGHIWNSCWLSQSIWSFLLPLLICRWIPFTKNVILPILAQAAVAKIP